MCVRVSLIDSFESFLFYLFYQSQRRPVLAFDLIDSLFRSRLQKNTTHSIPPLPLFFDSIQ